MAFRQSSSKDTISLGVKEVRSGRLESSWRRWRATWKARLVGILVKRDTTSNETSTSSSSSVCVVMNLAKLVELHTWRSELPTRGDKMLTRCFESEYVGDDMKDTMGLSGTSCLCTLGRAYSRGM